MTIPGEFYGNLYSILLTLIVAGIGYIARTARQVNKQVGRVYRTMFGEDGTGGGLSTRVERHGVVLGRHHGRLLRIETTLGLPDRRTEGESEEAP